MARGRYTVAVCGMMVLRAARQLPEVILRGFVDVLLSGGHGVQRQVTPNGLLPVDLGTAE